MSRELTSTEALNQVRELHETGRHAQAAALARKLIDQIVFGQHVLDRDIVSTILYAQTLLADAHLERGEPTRAQHEFDNILRRSQLDELALLRALGDIEDTEVRQRVAYGQIKQVELAASMLDRPDEVLARAEHGRRVASAAKLDFIVCFADHQYARALRLAGRIEESITLWLDVCARIDDLAGIGQPTAGYPSARSYIEAGLSVSVLRPGSATLRDIRRTLTAALASLNQWDLYAAGLLDLPVGLPTLEHVDSRELRSTQAAVWFDSLMDPTDADVARLLAAICDAPLASQLYYPWRAVLRRTRSGLAPSDRLCEYLDTRLGSLAPEISSDFSLPRAFDDSIGAAEAGALARIISL